MAGSGYWFNNQRYDTTDTATGSEQFAPEVPGQPRGFWREVHALSDPTSAYSQQNLYGGASGAEEQDIERAQGLSGRYGARAPISANFAPAQEVRGGQLAQLNQLQTAMAGDPNSAAQGQLLRGYGERANMLRSGAASARGGAANEALLAREAQTGIGEGEGFRAGAAAELMARERLAARPQYGALLGAVRGQDTSQAFGQAGLQASSGEEDDRMRLAYEDQALRTAQMGMQGRRARQSARQSAWQTANAQSNAAQENQRVNDENTTRTAFSLGQGALSSAGALWNQAQRDRPEQKKRGDEDY